MVDLTNAYRVLARKYRPTTFSDLIGQDVLVQTLTQAILSRRLAQAYILSGIRGVGKTTTARILARALNCVGLLDTNSDPTAVPCGSCKHCSAINENRHVDVLEMDAASHTGVNDIRELIEGVRYRPLHARYKVFIIDEIHMLSNQAFSALLKTLEEPPEHVKFIFATTEIHKVPATILSRCQRFDLHRVNTKSLLQLFGNIAEREGVNIEVEALQLIAHAADGSVRDGLSLLDQAIVRAVVKNSLETFVTAEEIRSMLGLIDRTIVFDILDSLLQGEINQTFHILENQYIAGADPISIIQEMLELSHWLTKIKLIPNLTEDLAMADNRRDRAHAMAKRLSVPVLSRIWQMLMKALVEIRMAPSPIQAIEMAFIRIAYTADLPTPVEAISTLLGKQKNENKKLDPSTISVRPCESPHSFADLVALCQEKGETNILSQITEQLNLVHFTPGKIKFSPSPICHNQLSHGLISNLEELLRKWTGRKWDISLIPSGEVDFSTNSEKLVSGKEQADKVVITTHPLVKAVLQAFPGSSVTSVHPKAKKKGDVETDM